MESSIKYNSSQAYFPTSKVSDDVKKSDAYSKQVADYVLAMLKAQPYNDLNTTAEDIGIANGKLPKTWYDYAANVYKGLDKENSHYPRDMKHLDLITPIKDRMMSEFIRLSKNFQVYIADPDITSEIDYQVKDEIQKQLAQEVINMFNESGMNTNMPSQPTIDSDELKKKITEDWKLEKGLEYTNRVRYLESLIDAETQYIQAFFYFWATDKVVTYRTVKGKELKFRVISPSNYMRLKGEHSRYIEDDMMGCEVGRMTLPELYVELSDYLDESEFNKIENAFKDKIEKNTVPGSGGGFSNVQVFVENMPSATQKININDTKNKGLNGYSLTYYHLVFKGFREIGVLDYLDETGQLSKMEVGLDYQMRPEYGDKNFTTEWVPTVYEQYVFITTGVDKIYTYPRLVQPQRENIANISEVKLPYNGIFGLLDDISINPLPRRVAPWNALYNIYRYKQETAIAKYRPGILTIPEEMLADSEETSHKTRMDTMLRSDILILNTDNVEQNSAAFNVLKALSLNQGGEYIKILEELCVSIRDSARDAANMNAQRYGDIQGDAGKGVTEYAISNASLASIMTYTMFNKFMERDYSANIDHTKIAWIDGVHDSFVDVDGTTKAIDIDGIEHYCSNIGVHFVNSSLEMIKLQRYQQLAEKFATTDNPELAFIAIDGESSIEIRSKIQASINKMQQAQQAKEAADRQAQIDMQQKQLEEQVAQRQDQIDIQKFLEAQKMAREELKGIVQIISTSKTDDDNLAYFGQLNSNLDIQEQNIKAMELKLKASSLVNDNLNNNRQVDAQLHNQKVKAAQQTNKK